MSFKQSNLLKFLGKNAENDAPPPKKTKSQEEKREYGRKYESTRVRSAQSQYTCLIQGSKTLVCKPCRQIYGPYGEESRQKDGEHNRLTKLAAGPFVTGYPLERAKHDALVTHNKSKSHQEAVSRVKARDAAPGTSSAEKIVHQLNQTIFNRLDKLFRNSHVIALHSKPFTDFVWMCKLDAIKGVDVGTTYITDKCCRQFINAIAETERKKITGHLKEANFVTILSDGSTDVSVSENEIVYIRFTVKGVTYTYFIGLVEVKKGDAPGIFNALKQALIYVVPEVELENILQKIICYCCDGASVNTGAANGVIALLRRNIYSNIAMIHCLVHRLELAYKDSVKGVKVYEKMSSMLCSLFKFYKVSPLQRNNLKATFQTLDKKVKLPLRTGGTRWLSHTAKALNNLWGGYEAIVLHLEQVVANDSQAQKAKAVGMLKMLKSKDVVMFAHFLHDVLGELQNMSLGLQQADASIYDCHHKLEVTMASLTKLQTRAGFYLRKVEDKEEFQNTKLVAGPGSVDSFSSARIKVIDNLLKSLEKRYKDVQQELLSAPKIASLKHWPVEPEPDYGDDFIATLVDHFSAKLEQSGIDPVLIDHEWTSLKNVLYNNQKPQELNWEAINVQYREDHQNVLVLSLPASTAECERGFSRMKIVKTDYRNKLKSDTMTDILTIQLHSEPMESFDPLPAIQFWNTSGEKPRRPNYMSTNTDRFDQHLVEVTEQQAAEAAAETTEEQKEAADATYDSDYDSANDLSDYSDYDSMSDNDN